MKRTFIGSIFGRAHGSDAVVAKVQGFVEAIRDQKRMVFFTVRDPSGIIQVVHDKKEGAVELTQTLAKLTEGSAVTVIGRVAENPQVKLGGAEIVASAVQIESRAESPLPINAESSLEKQMDWRAISLRRPDTLLIFKVQTMLERAMREFWEEEGFLEIHSPKLLATASESGAELFTLPYFGGSACLAQSPQFYKQMAMAAGFDRVFEIGPVFRANPSFTSRHDTEFTSVDMEFSWIKSHEDVMKLEEQWLRYLLERMKATYGDDIKSLFGVDVVEPSLPFPRITLSEARDVLAGYDHVISHKADLDPQGERLLAKYAQEKFGHEFIFVTEYPTSVRPFYHMRPDNDGSVTKSFDLLWKGLEITTGAQREHRYDILIEQAKEKGVALEPLQDYFNFFRYGCPPHGGAGIGLTRLLMVLLGKNNVREVTYLYRGPNRLRP